MRGLKCAPIEHHMVDCEYRLLRLFAACVRDGAREGREASVVGRRSNRVDHNALNLAVLAEVLMSSEDLLLCDARRQTGDMNLGAKSTSAKQRDVSHLDLTPAR